MDVTNTHTHPHTYTHIHAHTQNTHTHLHTYINAFIYTYIHAYCIHALTHTHTYIQTYIQTYKHLYTYTCTHTVGLCTNNMKILSVISHLFAFRYWYHLHTCMYMYRIWKQKCIGLISNSWSPIAWHNFHYSSKTFTARSWYCILII